MIQPRSCNFTLYLIVQNLSTRLSVAKVVFFFVAMDIGEMAVIISNCLPLCIYYM